MSNKHDKYWPIEENKQYFIDFLKEKTKFDEVLITKVVDCLYIHFTKRYFKKNELELKLLHNLFVIENSVDIISNNAEVFNKLKEKYEDIITANFKNITSQGSSQVGDTKDECTPKDIKEYIRYLTNQTGVWNESTNKTTYINRSLIKDYQDLLSTPSIYQYITQSIEPLYMYTYEKPYQPCNNTSCISCCKEQTFKDYINDPNFISLKEEMNEIRQSNHFIVKQKQGPRGEKGEKGEQGVQGEIGPNPIPQIAVSKGSEAPKLCITKTPINALVFTIVNKTFAELDQICNIENETLYVAVPKGDSGSIDNLKTINGEDIHGTGDIKLATIEQLREKQDKLYLETQRLPTGDIFVKYVEKQNKDAVKEANPNSLISIVGLVEWNLKQGNLTVTDVNNSDGENFFQIASGNGQVTWKTGYGGKKDTVLQSYPQNDSNFEIFAKGVSTPLININRQQNKVLYKEKEVSTWVEGEYKWMNTSVITMPTGWKKVPNIENGDTVIQGVTTGKSSGHVRKHQHYISNKQGNIPATISPATTFAKIEIPLPQSPTQTINYPIETVDPYNAIVENIRVTDNIYNGQNPERNLASGINAVLWIYDPNNTFYPVGKKG